MQGYIAMDSLLGENKNYRFAPHEIMRLQHNKEWKLTEMSLSGLKCKIQPKLSRFPLQCMYT